MKGKKNEVGQTRRFNYGGNCINALNAKRAMSSGNENKTVGEAVVHKPKIEPYPLGKYDKNSRQ